ncbi:MAG: acyl-CoA dehydrogenase family protein [Acidimicrobiales bacterium]
MEFSYPPSAEALRAEVRAFLAARPVHTYAIDAMDGGYGTGAYSFEFLRALGERGWIGLTWPRRFGGGERPMTDQLALMEELALAGAPFGPLAGSDQWAQSLIRDGNAALQGELLPRIAAGEALAWQGYSEPDAGSDLLALTTRARRDGDEYRIDGRKIWSSEAGACTHGMVLARTQSPEEAGSRAGGLTMFVVPNDTPGLTLRPIVSLTGEVYHYEAFLDDVRAPAWRIMGRENEGFRELLRGLDRDRFWGRFCKPAALTRSLRLLRDHAAVTVDRAGRLLDQPTVARRLVELEAEVAGTRLLFHRFGHLLDRGQPTPYESALYKTLADELGQRVANFALELLGADILRGGDDAPLSGAMRQLYLTSVGQTIAGGTSEVLRTTVATRGLGLARS